MELQQLKYFRTVAQMGKISDAAEALFVSPPALSTAISRLEKELGVPLFDRTGNRITLNTQGKVFLKYVDQIFTSLESAKTEVQQSLLQKRPQLSLAILNSHMWVNLIATFLADFPGYTLSYARLSQEDLSKGRSMANYDFFLAYRGELPPSWEEKLDSVALFDAYPAVMLHQHHPLAENSRLTIAQLASQRLLLPVSGGALYGQLQKLFASQQIPFPASSSYSLMVRQRMVANNTGVSFSSMHPDYMPLPNVRYIPLADIRDQWEARLFWRKDRPLTPQQQAFRDFAVSYYSQHKV